MKITTIQWNIGGGKIRSKEANPASMDSYDQEGLDYICQILEKYNS